jgi:tungstate transport system ATP-binding protein
MNMTTLFVTHDYTEIPYLAQQVAVLFEGRIIRSGSVREVFGDELLDRRVCVPWEIP